MYKLCILCVVYIHWIHIYIYIYIYIHIHTIHMNEQGGKETNQQEQSNQSETN